MCTKYFKGCDEFHKVAQTDYADIRAKFYHIPTRCIKQLVHPHAFLLLKGIAMYNPFKKNLGPVHMQEEADSDRPVKWVEEKPNVWRIVYADRGR